MKNQNKITGIAMALILVALSPYANASQLSNREIQSIRTVLRELNFDDRMLSNSEIEMLHRQGSQQFEESYQQYNKRLDNEEVQLTCGAGSHGGSKDPV